MDKQEKLTILTEAYEILIGAHDETETTLDHYIKQDLDPQYVNSMADAIEQKTFEDGWNDEEI